ncbi:MAG: hypothetical protein N3G20_07120, partial [Verrucomicrobiae bacterium]|nr:hypothetical protein [Verrucomicrobiae bacterium]
MGYVKVSGDLTRVQNETVIGSLDILKGGVEVSGGWNDTFTAQIGRSILHANASNVYTNRVFDISGTNVVIRDFVITGGGIRGYQQAKPNGAGLRVTGTNIVLQSLIVTNNTSYDNYVTGAGIAILGRKASNVTVTRCKIVNNYARHAGGIYVGDNAGRYGRPVVIEYCDIMDNFLTTQAGTTGGGVYTGDSALDTFTRALVANCRI